MIRNEYFWTIVFLLCMWLSVYALGAKAAQFNEDHYNREWCTKYYGQAEVWMYDRNGRGYARIDCAN